MSVQHVSDTISNLNDQIANAAKVIGRARQRALVFQAIYRGKKTVKTRDEIAEITGLPSKRVLEEGRKLSANHVVEQLKVKGETAYKKISPFTAHYRKVLQLATDKKKLSKFPTKINPVNVSGKVIIIKQPIRQFDVVRLAIDEIDSFSQVTRVPNVSSVIPVLERPFKQGIKRILGETGKFMDWGGERNDLFTTRLILNGKRIQCAFAFKGRGTKGILKLSMMGKNGDQIPILFQSDADIYILQYWGQVDQSVYELMHRLAVYRSAIELRRIYYCIIDGQDTSRILAAYATFFNQEREKA
jgi:hypothetical protein